MKNRGLDYNEYIEIADGIYWVGFADGGAGLHCNPYLIVEGEEAVLLDSGSRDHFSTVMLKIMRTGTLPGQIKRLIYHHYDPDLCGNLMHMEAIINSPGLRIISHCENNIFISYYSAKSPKDCIERLGMEYRFASGRRLRFVRIPYAHSCGSFMTFDDKTKILFSSDLFGSYDSDWGLYTTIVRECAQCIPQEVCPATGKRCQLMGILNFNKRVMTSEAALRYALDRVEELEADLIAPQHGSLLHTPEARRVVIDRLRLLTGVGIGQFLEEAKR